MPKEFRVSGDFISSSAFSHLSPVLSRPVPSLLQRGLISWEI
jgi:hypothetical protein